MTKRLARTAGAVALIAIGVPLLVLPGPGLLLIGAGLSLLAVDYAWARRLVEPVRARLKARTRPARRG